jgi:DNA invertase Pin-like site-specific DNA recombinase
LARSLRQLIDTTVLLNEHGVEIHSLTENIDTTTPSGKPTFHVFAALAEFERDILRQRETQVSRAPVAEVAWAQTQGAR